MTNIGREIRNKRKELGLTQHDVVGDFMSIAKLSNIENGKKKPDPETWEYLKQKLGLSDELVHKKESIDKILFVLEQAETYYKSGIVDKAIEKYEEAIELAPRFMLFNETAQAYKELGFIAIEEKNYKQALNYLEKAIRYYEDLHDQKNALECRAKVGVVYFRQEKLVKSLSCFQDILNDIKDEQDLIGPIYYNMASVYYTLNNMDAANYACEKALGHLNEQQLDYLISTLILQAILLKEAKMFLLAKGKLEQAKDLSIKHNKPVFMAKCWHNLGEVEMEIKHFDNALNYFNLSLEVKEQLEDQVGIIRTKAFMAELHLKMGQVETALEIARDSLRMARNIYSKSEEIISLKALSKIYLELDEEPQFLDVTFKAITLADELKLDMKKMELYENVAKHFYKKGDHDRCLDMLHKAFLVKLKIEEMERHESSIDPE
ncbi:MAG: tetratricopeptide repeat protein [Bacillaceae bacterium]|nr:tetratricopeptide repeat protein [Bacillaceae bacterium]